MGAIRTRAARWHGAVARDSLWVAALALLTGVGGWSLVSAQNVSAQAVLGTEPVALPSFADLLARPRSPTEGESCCSDADRTVYERARTDARFELLKLTYRSEDLPVVAFVYRAKATGNKRPVVVYNRGSLRAPGRRAGAARPRSTGWPMQGSWWSLPCTAGVRAPLVAMNWAAPIWRI
jgi:hypothetical protein